MYKFSINAYLQTVHMKIWVYFSLLLDGISMQEKGLIYVWNWLYKEGEGGHLAFQKVILYHYGSKYSIVVYQQVWPKVVKHVVFWPESHYSNIARNIALSIAHKTIVYGSKQTFLTALTGLHGRWKNPCTEGRTAFFLY